MESKRRRRKRWKQEEGCEEQKLPGLWCLQTMALDVRRSLRWFRLGQRRFRARTDRRLRERVQKTLWTP